MGLRPPDDRRESQRDRLDEVARLSIAAVAEDLVRILGLKRTAVIGAVKDTRIVQQWIRAEQFPLSDLKRSGRHCKPRAFSRIATDKTSLKLGLRGVTRI